MTKQRDKNKINALMQQPTPFEVGGESFLIDSWTLTQQTQILTTAITCIMDKGMTEQAAANLNDMKNKNPLSLIPFFMDLLTPVLVKIYAITLGKPETWIDKNVVFLKNLELFRIIWNKNDLPEILKNLLDLVREMQGEKTEAEA